MEKKHFFFVDAETDGLYGSFISVAIVVTDINFNEVETKYIGISKSKLDIKDDWVRENVVPILGDYEECDDENELLDKVWNIWSRYKVQAYAIGDVIYPVESRLFMRCVMENPVDRKFEGPFPFLDLSTLLYSKGIDPLCERKDLIARSDIKQHNALDDVRITIELWKKYSK